MKNHRPLEQAAFGLVAAAVVGTLPTGVLAQGLEEIVVTATRRESSLQDTPIAIQAFSADDLDLGGIEAGRDLGIMVPNVVLNPGLGQGQADFYIRGLPGVGIYIDGVWQGPFGFQQTNFVEMERVEVLLGPQGTLFGRNTNGGAINMTTRQPGEEFGARINLDVGEFNRRDLSMAVDLPFSDRLKTKFTVASLENDGFLESISVPRSFGDQDDTLVRADILWEPTDTISLRFTANDEDKSGTDARIVQFTNTEHPRYLAYNILAGNPDFLATARAIDPMFPDPPKQLANDRFTPESHEPGFPGGRVGQWQTTSDTMEDGIKQDLKYYTLTMNWDITSNLSLESITSTWELNRRQVVDFDGSEFTITTDDVWDFDENLTQELHLTGSNFDGRLNWLAGYYFLEQKNRGRFYRWGLWEFTIPNTGPADPALDFSAINYVRNYGALVGNPALETFFPISFITDDSANYSQDEDTAIFGEAVWSVTDRLDLTFGVRVTSDDGFAGEITPTSAFRTNDPQIRPAGDVYAGTVATRVDDPDLGNITTNKFAVQYSFDNNRMLYFSWGEGFTSGGVTISPNFPDPIILDPEIITTRELGFKSDLLGGRLRFNASYFESDWDGLRVPILPPDPDNPGQSLPFPVNTSEGLAETSGAEFSLNYLPSDRWMINFGLGMLDTNWLDLGFVDPTGNGIQPGSPFAYAPDLSYSLGVTYDLPVSNGHVMFVGQYGWMDEYVRDPAAQRTPVDANGNFILEPSYGILNARVVYERANADWNIALWGRNLTDEYYINGGFDTRFVWGYDFTVIGRSREIGMSLGFAF